MEFITEAQLYLNQGWLTWLRWMTLLIPTSVRLFMISITGFEMWNLIRILCSFLRFKHLFQNQLKVYRKIMMAKTTVILWMMTLWATGQQVSAKILTIQTTLPSSRPTLGLALISSTSSTTCSVVSTRFPCIDLPPSLTLTRETSLILSESLTQWCG